MAKVLKKPEITFEAAMGRLDEIVGQMESAELPLEKILEAYEEGMKLVQFCGDKLQAAEQKIELLTRDKTGTYTPSTLDDGGPEPASSTDEEAGDGPGSGREVSLF
jgi:exodeoxyribonuclease VII small subunit